MRDLPALDLEAVWAARTLGSGGCCWQSFWDASDPEALYSIDGEAGQRASVYRWDLAQPFMGDVVEQAPPAPRSPDGSYRITMEGADAILTRLSDGVMFRAPTEGETPALNPANTHVLWVQARPTVPGEARAPSAVRVLEVGRTTPTELWQGAGVGAQWVDDRRVLVTVPGEQRTTRLVLVDVMDGAQTDLGTYTWMRGLSVGPGGRWLVMMLTYQAEPQASGVVALRLEAGAQPVMLGWLGGWRWRDADELYVIPMQPDSDPAQALYHHDLSTQTLTRLNTPAFTVMNGDWRVSADGRRIAYRELATRELTVLELR
jgi:hypothetical protein